MSPLPNYPPCPRGIIECLGSHEAHARGECDFAPAASQAPGIEALASHGDPEECPTYYDGCNCTVGALVHNIERAERAESALASARRERDEARSSRDAAYEECRRAQDRITRLVEGHASARQEASDARMALRARLNEQPLVGELQGALLAARQEADRLRAEVGRLREALGDLLSAAERMMDRAPVLGRAEAEAMDRARALAAPGETTP